MKYGFIGCGNMGSALIRALAKKTKEIIISDHDDKKASLLADELGITAADNAHVALECERIFLGVKPQMMEQMLSEIAPLIKCKNTLLITMAAGLKMSRIAEFSCGDYPIIRIMPNTPVSVGKGMVLYCANSYVSNETLNDFVNDMQYAGTMDKIEEPLIDAACAVSGCGPAFMYVFASAIAKGATECGLTYERAIKYAAETMRGAAELLINSKKTPEQLTDAVCSKGGSTIEGVKILEGSDFKKIVSECIKAAYNRNCELAK